MTPGEDVATASFPDTPIREAASSAATRAQSDRGRITQLIGISFASLFLEMALIRFINSTVQVIAYFNNFVILAAFMGLGFGALLLRRVQNLFGRFPFVLAGFVAILITLDRVTVASSDQTDLVTWTAAHAPIELPTGLVIASIFIGCFFVFMPLGWQLGRCLDRFDDRLAAYGYDLLGSILGVLTFTLMSWTRSAPWLWFTIGCSVIAWLLWSEGAKLPWRVAMLLMVVAAASSTNGYYSPYYKIELSSVWRTGAAKPVFYSVMVDKVRIQDAIDFSQDLSDTPVAGWPAYYQLPYKLRRPARVLVLGGGSGNDTAVALQSGATQVDVVEVDPVLVDFGHVVHPQRPYEDPRVHAVNDDARAFLRRTARSYDTIVMNALDSHHQLPGLSTLRLESYIYTVEAFRDVRRHMHSDSIFVVHLSSTRPWMGERLYWSLTEAFGREPALLTTADSPFRSVAFVYAPANVLAAARSAHSGLLWGSAEDFRASRSRTDLATDDWPHLYLATRSIPTLYLQVLAFVLIATLGSFLALDAGKWRTGNLHFLLLGASFMLLETRAITQFALLFGSTWLVNAIVVTAILSVIYFGNRLISSRLRVSTQATYAALLLALLALYFLPLDFLLQFSQPVRILGAGLVVGAPVFLASLLFSLSFRAAPNVAEAFGANLIGVVIGGALEYSSMQLGLRFLYLIAFVLYAAAWLAERRFKSGISS